MEKCTICQRRLVDPKTLPCLHTFCSSCLIKLKKDKGNQTRCPQCRESVPLNEEEIIALSVSPFVKALLESSGKGEQNNQNPICEDCEDQEAVNHCIQCQKSFCQDCKDRHLKKKSCANHTFAPLAEIGLPPIKQRISKCLEHNGLEIDAYCKKCDLPVCPKCGIQKHTGHELVLLKDYANDNLKPELEAWKKKAESRITEISDGLTLVGLSLDELANNKEKGQQTLKAAFNEIRQELDTREAVLSAQLDQHFSVMQKELQIQRDDLEIVREGILASGEFTNQLLKEGTEVEIVLNKNAVIERLKTLNEMNVMLSPVYNPKVEIKDIERGKKQAFFEVLSNFGNIKSEVTKKQEREKKEEGEKKQKAKEREGLLWLAKRVYGESKAEANLPQLNQLTTLSLSNNNIGAEGMEALALALPQLNQLTELDLSRNNIGAEGMEALALALPQLNHLTKLYLYRNNIGAEGVKALALALPQLNQLTELGLSYNNIGDEGKNLLNKAKLPQLKNLYV